jgi:hypothetical protein
MKTMFGFDEPHPYPEWNFTYRTEHVKANEVQRLIVYNTTYISKVLQNNVLDLSKRVNNNFI